MTAHLLALLLLGPVPVPDGTVQDPPSVNDPAPPAPPATPADARRAYDRLVAADHWRQVKAAGKDLVAFGDEAPDLLRRGAEDRADEAIRRRCYDLLLEHWPVDPATIRTVQHHGLEDASPTIRYMCAFHLGAREVFGSFRRLQAVLADAENDELTRLAAAKSLAELGEADGLPLLYDGLGSDWYMPRYLANLGIEALSGKDLNDFDYDFAEGAFVSGGVEARGPRRPIEDAERRARRHLAIAAWCRWLRESRPELYKHIDGAGDEAAGEGRNGAAFNVSELLRRTVMITTISRRTFLAASAAPVALAGSATPAAAAVLRRFDGGVPESYPAQEPEVVRTLVRQAHVDVDAVRELVTRRPELAKATWDWGFGDWESGLGAASHMGRRDIAELLIAHGARPNLFTFAMLGQVDVVRAACEANPGIQRIRGPHGITLLRHARMGGEAAESVVAFLDDLGDADIGEPDEPLTEEVGHAYVGEYEPADAPDVVFHVQWHERRGIITIGRGDGPARFLKHRGEHEFAPGGAPSVRLRFDGVDGDGGTRRLTILDGELRLTAARR